MTSRKPDAKRLSLDFIPRPHYACRLREDLHKVIKDKCKELNISQGVFLEILVSKAELMDAITEKDVYQYDHAVRWLHKVVDDYQKTGVMMGAHNLDVWKREKMLSIFSRVLAGETPTKSEIFE
jgi:hypothetical protein